MDLEWMDPEWIDSELNNYEWNDELEDLYTSTLWLESFIRTSTYQPNTEDPHCVADIIFMEPLEI